MYNSFLKFFSIVIITAVIYQKEMLPVFFHLSIRRMLFIFTVKLPTIFIQLYNYYYIFDERNLTADILGLFGFF